MATASEQISSAAVSAPPASRPATKLKRVLVVDKPWFSALVQRMLTGRFDVMCVADAVEAIKASKIRRPDLVVCELGVRGGGLRLAELLDMNVKAVHTPFILTCIKPSSDLVERATRAGIDEVLIKPFPPQRAPGAGRERTQRAPAGAGVQGRRRRREWCGRRD